MNQIIRKQIIATLMISIIAKPVYAGFGLKNVFDNLYVNHTSAGVYKNAASGWYSAGSTSIRTQNTAIKPFAMTAPSIKSGCNGIDAHFGSFSMISGEELTRLIKRLGKDAPVYGMHLAMKTYAPQIEQTLQNLRNLSMQLNQAGIGHCHAVQAGFAGLLPKNSAMYENVCEDLARQGGSDIGGQRKKCRDFEAQQAAAESMQQKDKNLLLDNYNIFIKAADAAHIPEDMRPVLMSMTGTIVVKERAMIPYPSLAKNRRNMEIYLYGGANASMYSCDNERCLNITLNNDIKITEDESHSGQVRTKLNKLKNKMIEQQADYDDNEQQFISSLGTRFDIFKHIMLEASANVSILDGSSEAVAKYVFFEHINSVSNKIKASVTMLKQRQFDEKYLTQYEKQLDVVIEFARRGMREASEEADRVEVRAEKILRHVMAKERG